MANKLITPSFRVHIANQFKESFDEEANTIYYMFAGKSTPYINEPIVPDVTGDLDSVLYQSFDEMIFGKHIKPTDVANMIREIQWIEGTVYDIYDDDDPVLETKDFYISVLDGTSQYTVFKCLNNNNGAQSVVAPTINETEAEDVLYQTSDGYQWKYMYTIPISIYNQFAANGFIPVVANTEVTNAAANGAIETILVEQGGMNYNSYAEGKIKEATVSGNTLAYSIYGEMYKDVDLIVDPYVGKLFSDFVHERVVSYDSQGNEASGIIVDIDEANNRLRLHRVDGTFKSGSEVVGDTSKIVGTILSVTRLTEEISANTDFYKNSSIYISTGRGAGQVKKVSEYSVTGDDRLVYIDSPFDIEPQDQDDFYIGPRVRIDGDGYGAEAIAIVNESANAINNIQITSRGQDYSYANITIEANTGLQDREGVSISANTAQARAVIPPQGGHGFDPVEELYATRIGIGAKFENDERGTITVDNDFRKIGIIKEPRFANTVLTLDTTSFIDPFVDIIQDTTGATASVTARNQDGDNTVRLGMIRGFFESGYPIVAIQDTTKTANVLSVDRSLDTFEQLYKYSVNIIDNGDGSAFTEDDYVFQTETLSSGYIHSINNIDGETIITLVNVKGHFSISDTATGFIRTFVGENGAEAELLGEIKPDLEDNQGQVIYIENSDPIQRDISQTEKVKLILEF